ncbi:class I SAM-dependent methyltransferase [Thiospirillum jenense]|uniref:Methyltransferase domain-containing protein n=1 Tax=Thiospirillum jenense TaxID=1653858 RepID=A0A839HIP7_9GAMM|nr:class I SAM-dependent methyltransferase [Thiospirillum jenense]MBB1126559.1 methyltransferase domain-containing protein [Thiospirillum jenense]
MPPELTPATQIDSNTLIQLRCALHWRSVIAKHCDIFYANRINLWRDLLPRVIEQDLPQQPLGYQKTYQFATGELLPASDERKVFRLAPRQFNGRFSGRAPVYPRSGRFYPRGILQSVAGVFSEDRNPFRMIDLAAHPNQPHRLPNEFHADFNHPLANYPLELQLTVNGIYQQGEERGGRSNDLIELLTNNGPGMQTRWRDFPTDFWSDLPFLRKDGRPDTTFYNESRLIAHLDNTAQLQLQNLYGQLLPNKGRVLDLMSSWQSHLPPTLELSALVGLGLNQAELDANPQLTERVVHDLNHAPQLPFTSASFDAVICSLSVEYLIEPVAVFKEIARVLNPGGVCVIAFSNRWFPTKAIHLWEGVHEFERPGLVLEYFLMAGGFTALETLSVRGLPRPDDDKYAEQMALSDPLYAVWAQRANETE